MNRPTKRYAVPFLPSPLPERHSFFVASTDPKVTTCHAWKVLMQVRQNLLTNPRQDAGIEGWWSTQVRAVQCWLYGGGDYGDGYYGPQHRITTPDCVVLLSDVKFRRHRTFTPSKAFEADERDRNRMMLFPANSTYLYEGYVIDWSNPFPGIADRQRLVEWIESWIDWVSYIEATGSFPWERKSESTVATANELLIQLRRLALTTDSRSTHHAGNTLEESASDTLNSMSIEPIDEFDAELLAFLNRRPELRRKVSDIQPDKGPQDRKAIAARLRRLADRKTPLVDFPNGGRKGVAILPAGQQALKRIAPPKPH